MSTTDTPVAQHIDLFRERFTRITREVGRRIVGHEDIVQATVTSLLAGGHVLLEGIPGVGKTSLVHTLADVLHLKFSRIQFTPDLMPADIVGTNIVQEHSHGGTFFEFQPGPIFANIVLADEINRATPKNAIGAARGMQEMTVSVGKTTYKLEEPFLVLATQNPLEMEGTYPLPEAQLDRFFFKLKITYPPEAAMHEILNRTTQVGHTEVSRIVDGAEILEMRQIARGVPIAKPVQGYAIKLTLGTHPQSPYATPLIKKYVRYGASPRAAQALVLAGKIHALTRGNAFVGTDDIRAVAMPALRHRILMNFEGEADEVNADALVKELLDMTSEGRVVADGVIRSRGASAPRRVRRVLTDAPIRGRLPQEARVPACRVEARVCRTESSRSAGAQARPRPGVRRPSRVHAGRRLPPHRLEGLQAAEPAAAQAVRRRAGSPDLSAPRHKPFDGAARKIRSSAPHRGGALLHRPLASRSRHDDSVFECARR